jgi:hypothetical protein
VNRSHASTLAVKSASNMHQAGVVRCSANFGTCIQDISQLVAKHGHRSVCILEGKCASKAAALFGAWQFNKVNAAYRPQQLQGGITYV